MSSRRRRAWTSQAGVPIAATQDCDPLASGEAMSARPIKARLHDDDLLFFLRLPKTASSSLTSVIEAHFSRWEILPSNSPFPADRYGAFSPARLATYRFAKGHSDRWTHVIQTAICITMLRDPVLRTISHYRYLLRTRRRHHHRALMPQRIGLKEFVCDPRFYEHVVNVQVRGIVGPVKGRPEGYDDPNAMSGEALLVLAKQRLDQLAFVGLTERFSESVELLAYTFGWAPVVRIPFLNAAPEPPNPDSIPHDTLDAIMERTSLDAELYAYATKLFEARLEQMRQDSASFS